MNKTRTLIAGAVIAGSLSVGAAGMTLGAGGASAEGLSDRPCNPYQYYCGGHLKPSPYLGPVLLGPGYPRR